MDEHRLQRFSVSRRRMLAGTAGGAVGSLVPMSMAIAAEAGTGDKRAPGTTDLVLSGRVVDAASRPVAAAKLEFRAAGSLPVGATTDADGRFLLVARATPGRAGTLRVAGDRPRPVAFGRGRAGDGAVAARLEPGDGRTWRAAVEVRVA